MRNHSLFKSLGVWITFLHGSFLWGGDNPRLGEIPRVIPIEEKVSIIARMSTIQMEQGTYEMRLERLVGKGEAVFENGENRFPLEKSRRALITGIEASSQINNIALSLYHEDQRIDTILLTVVNPELIRFDEAIAAAQQRLVEIQNANDTEEIIWGMRYPLPSVFLQEDKNRFIVQYPNHFVSDRGSTKERIRVTFLVDSRTGEIENVLVGALGKNRLE